MAGVNAVQIGVDGTITVLPDAEYATLKAALGGWIEACPSAPDVILWVDEEGKLKGLPFNPVANALWAHVDYYDAMKAGDYIVGPCVVTGGADAKGDTTPVPPWVLDELGVVAEA